MKQGVSGKKFSVALLGLLIPVVTIVACSGGSSTGASAGNPEDGSAVSLFTACEDPRSQACTREYRPVCGLIDTGELNTFANACTACASESTVGFYPDACNLPAMTACTEPRPKVCTADYRPACGVSVGGDVKTYGNACNACGDATVIGYVDGECPLVQ